MGRKETMVIIQKKDEGVLNNSKTLFPEINIIEIVALPLASWGGGSAEENSLKPTLRHF